MTCWVRLFSLMLAVLVVAGLNGCVPSSQSQLEEEKEPHFLAGKSCINSLDYKGAIEQFEKAVEVNPRSASAHFQLGCLYEKEEPDPAAAIYHFEKFLKLRPEADTAEMIKVRIMNCKQDLAKTALPLQVTPDVQRQIEQLAEEKARLQEENDRWRVYFRSQNPTNTIVQGPPDVRHTQTGSGSFQPSGGATGNIPPNPSSSNRIVASIRTYRVQSGDTPTSIARRYGVKLDMLMSANPGLDPLRMRVGQTVNIPPP